MVNDPTVFSQPPERIAQSEPKIDGFCEHPAALGGMLQGNQHLIKVRQCRP
jgi:hypothetical protein